MCWLLPLPPTPAGIINGGVVQALFDCHGNWTAAIALMDKAALPKPPLTLTYEMLVGGRWALGRGLVLDTWRQALVTGSR